MAIGRKGTQRRGSTRSRIFTAMEPVTFAGLNGMDLLRLAFAAMLAILFLQSSLDKLFNWKGEKEYLTGHFAKSILKGSVPFLLPLITLVEFSAGTCSAIGFVRVLMTEGTFFGGLGATLGATAITMLFFGQRVSKDYAGAASLVPYFLMCAAGIWVFMP
jgi:hypothetical protein